MNSVKYLPNKVKNILRYNIPISNLRILMDNITYKDIENYVKYNKNSYQRIQLATSNKQSLYLMCWSPKQFSLIHDHPAEGCIFKVLKGNLDEITYDNNIVRTESLSVNDYAFRYGDEILHKVVNNDNYAVTMHVYPINYTPKFYPDILIET